MLKRLFLATENPELTISFDERLIKIDDKGVWKFPLSISNLTSAVAEKIKIFVVIENFEECDTIDISNFKDNSNINPQFKKVLIYTVDDVVYKGLDLNVGNVSAKLKGKKRALYVTTTLYANKMIPKVIKYKIFLIKNKFNSQLISEDIQY